MRDLTRRLARLLNVAKRERVTTAGLIGFSGIRLVCSKDRDLGIDGEPTGHTNGARGGVSEMRRAHSVGTGH